MFGEHPQMETTRRTGYHRERACDIDGIAMVVGLRAQNPEEPDSEPVRALACSFNHSDISPL